MSSLRPVEVFRFEVLISHCSFATKARAIRENFGVSPVKFYSELNRMLDSDALAAAYPWFVSLLRQRRAQRARMRRGEGAPPIEKAVPQTETEKSVPSPETETVTPKPEVERR